MMTWLTTTDLHPHQHPPVKKLLRSRVGGLFMEMGTGKTRVAIEFAQRRQHKIDRCVWFCPVSLKETIVAELEKHTTATVYVFDEKTRAHTLPGQYDWYIVGLESISGSDRVTLAANSLITPKTFVIVDESNYIKGHHSLRTQRLTVMSSRAKYRLILTGTPMSQGYQDLFAQMRFLSPKILGYYSFYSFAANHLEYSEDYPGLIIRAHNTDWLAAKISPYIYQITKDEAGLNLPGKLYDSRYFRLTNAQWEAYEQAKWEILIDCPEDEFDSYVIFQLFTALQQIVSGFWYKNGTLIEYPHYRLETLVETLEDLPEGEQVIIWAKYRYSVQKIAEVLGERYGRDSVSKFYGELNEAQRSAELKKWRQAGRFLVATMATGGHGLTLNEAAYTIFYENAFNYAHRQQAEDRNHRLGQTRRPTYIDLASRSKIEDRISKALARKGHAVKGFKRAVQTMKTMNREEMKQYLSQNL